MMRQTLELKEENRKNLEMLDKLKSDLSEEKLKAEITDALMSGKDKLTEDIVDNIGKKLDEKTAGILSEDKKN